MVKGSIIKVGVLPGLQSQPQATPQAMEARDFQLSRINNITQNYLELSESLLETMEKNYFVSFGCRNMWEYTEKELGIRAQKARYLVQTAKFRLKIGPAVTTEEWKELGASKARFLTAYAERTNLDTDKVRGLVDKYKDKDFTVQEMRKEFSTGAEGVPPAPAAKKIKLVFPVERDTWSVITRAMEQIKKEEEDPLLGDSTCLELICADYLSGASMSPTERIKDALDSIKMKDDQKLTIAAAITGVAKRSKDDILESMDGMMSILGIDKESRDLLSQSIRASIR